MDIPIQHKYLSQRGKLAVVVENYKFTEFRKNREGAITYRCSNRRCRVILSTDSDVKRVLTLKNEHNHSPKDDEVVQREKLSSSLKRKAVVDITAKPNKLIQMELLSSPSTSKSLPRENFNLIRKTMYNARRKIIPAVSNSLDECRKYLLKKQEMSSNMKNEEKSETAEQRKEENKDIPVRDAVFKHSEPLPDSFPAVRGYDFNKGVDYKALLSTYKNSGFQATSLGLAIDEVNRMLDCREQPLEPSYSDISEEDPFIRRRTNCTIFLGYTSNMVSCGIRDTIRFLVQHKMVDCIVTTAGGVEEDLIKCLGDTYVGDFHLDGRTLRDKAINRIGNLLVPNDNYCKFEDWILPKLDTLLEEQRKNGKIWSPSTIIEQLGRQIDDPNSILYWAAKNEIPVFCPALTDGSLGDMMYFHSYKNSGLIIDILQDLRRLNTMAVRAANTGMIIVGGGVVKHHICNANLMRNGADFAVFINTSSEFDGSDAGARPDEAISWGKIRKNAQPVKVYAEATLVFPLLVGETFATRHFAKEKS